jgi:hypothetical protein
MFTLLCCTSKQGKSEFDAFLETIPPVKTPREFTYFSRGVPPYYYNDSFGKFKTTWTKRTMTKLSSKVGKFVVLVDADTGILNVPFLVSYTEAGRKIDSVMPIQAPVYEDTFSVEQKLIVDHDKFVVRRTVRSWKTNGSGIRDKDGYLVSDDLIYLLSVDGRFELKSK